jgi:hypothetical protein
VSAPPKLPTQARERILTVVRQRRYLMREIARLTDERRLLPNNKQLARQLNISYSVVRRTLHGDPYKKLHPDDLTTSTATARHAS